MANSYPILAPVSASEVGTHFIKQYYRILQQRPDFVHQFYTEASSMVRVDGESTDTAEALLQIHTLIMSQSFSGIEIKTVDSLESLGGGVLVVVSGSVKSMELNCWRKFMQTFLLAPQKMGYFVLNDIFHFISEPVIHQQHPPPMLSENRIEYQHPTPMFSENRVDYQHQGSTLQEDRVDYQNQSPVYLENNVDYQHQGSRLQEERVDCQNQQPVYLENRVDSQLINSAPLSESPDVPDYELEVTEHFDSVHIEGDEPVEEYSFHEQQHQEADAVVFVNGTPLADSSAVTNNVDRELEPLPAVEEPVGEPKKFTYASILQASKGKPVPSVVAHPYPTETASPVSEWDSVPEPNNHPPHSVSSYAAESNVEPVEESFSQQGESISVYVKNLPPTVSTLDILQEFENFGGVRPDGVFIKHRKEVGVCFAFVEFEDVESVQNAIKASPIQLAGRQVYIEERRPSSNSYSNLSRGGGRRGRGRGIYQNEAVRGRFGGRSFGRGNYQDGNDNYRSRGNNIHGSY